MGDRVVPSRKQSELEFDQKLMKQGVNYCQLKEIAKAAQNYQLMGISQQPMSPIYRNYVPQVTPLNLTLEKPESIQALLDVVAYLKKHRVGSLATTIDSIHNSMLRNWRIVDTQCDTSYKREYTPPML